MRRARARSAILVGLLLLWTALVPDSPLHAAWADTGPDPVPLRVMTFNIEWGGTHVSFDSVVEAILRSEADVAGIQEAEGNLERLARRLGWNFDEHNYIIARVPLLDPPGADGRYVLVEVRPGQVVAVANLHLPSAPYGPDLVRDGAGAAAVVANECTTRVPALRPYLEVLPTVAEAGIPVIVTGDFNAPAHTDWTADLVGRREFLHYPIAWPVSLAMQEAGFRDSWRALYPNPATRPGLTWWAGRPALEAYTPGANDARDRIDQVWFAGRAVPGSARIVGEAGGPEVSIEVSPWPSDHRAVVVDFSVFPAPVPDLLTTDRRVYREGDAVEVRYVFTRAGEQTVSIRNFADDSVMTRMYANGAQGSFVWPAAAAGHFRAVASAAGSSFEREFWVLADGATPSIEAAKSVFQPGEPITIRWSNAPGYRNDYIAVFAQDSSGVAEDMLGYAYVKARPEGQLDIGASLQASGTPLAAGSYRVMLMKDDGYEALAASAAFDIL